MREILLRQSVSFVLDLANDQNKNIDFNIDIRFIPDELIVRQLSYVSDTDGEPLLVRIYTNMLQDQILAIFPVIDNSAEGAPPTIICQQLETHFNWYNNVLANQYNFQIQNGSTGEIVDENVSGIVSLMMEFIKYAK